MSNYEYKVFTKEFDEQKTAPALLRKHFGRIVDSDRWTATRNNEKDPYHGVSFEEAVKRVEKEYRERLNKLLEEYIVGVGIDRAEEILYSPIEGLDDDVSVSLLLDNSGSLRGRPAVFMHFLAATMADKLELSSVPVEVLGYTTAAWKGGQSRKKWLAAGRPIGPGRLNDLQHVVYKPFELSQQEETVARGYTLMTLPGLQKENIDGEALEWACERMNKRAKRRNVILHVADGSPADDSTITQNPKDYLRQHQRAVLQGLANDPGYEVYLVKLGKSRELVFEKMDPETLNLYDGVIELDTFDNPLAAAEKVLQQFLVARPDLSVA